MKVKLLKVICVLFLSNFLNVQSFAAIECKDVYISTELRVTFFKYKIIDLNTDEFLLSGQLGYIANKLLKNDKTKPTQNEIKKAANDKNVVFKYCPGSDDPRNEENSSPSDWIKY